jgi:hypothetical protein
MPDTQKIACSLCKRAVPEEIHNALADLFRDEGIPTPEMVVCPDCADSAPDAVLGMMRPKGVC